MNQEHHILVQVQEVIFADLPLALQMICQLPIQQVFNTLGVIPFNINPHYLDPNPQIVLIWVKHVKPRIQEFHHFNSQPVIGLREGSYLEVLGSKITLKGPLNARVFKKNKMPYEIQPESDVSNLN